MLTLTIEGTELFDQDKEEFISSPSVVLHLEHSLVALSKWESKFEKPFLGDGIRNAEELRFYAECMVVDDEFPPEVFRYISDRNYLLISEYIDSKQTATFFGKMPQKKVKGEVITAELIYYWLVAFNIPFSTETWHLNRLFALIQVCNVKNQPPKKRSKTEMAQERFRINEERKAAHGTRG